jgi:hypothetical protein
MGKREYAPDVGAGILAPGKAHDGSMAATKSQRCREKSVALLPLAPWRRVIPTTGVRAFHHGEQSAGLGRSHKEILLP